MIRKLPEVLGLTVIAVMMAFAVHAAAVDLLALAKHLFR
jgi:hypothetical protein